MDLDVPEAAQLLDIPDERVYELIRSGSLPAHRIAGGYRLNRVELQEWATAHDVRLFPDALAAQNAHERLSLAAAVERGGVHRDVPGRTREEVLGNVVRGPGLPPGIDADILLALLLRREALASTGTGGGVAIPHPRTPLVLHAGQPRVLLCFLAQPVDFQAIDGRPVHTLFILLSGSVAGHLQLLSRIAYALHDPALRALVDRRGPTPEILARLTAIEAETGRR